MVYFDSHRKIFSLKCPKTRRVEIKAGFVELVNCNLTVYPRGRERVLRTNRKNVHAYVLGDLVRFNGAGVHYPTEIELKDLPYDIYYNPYTCENFVGLIGKTRKDLFKCHKIIMWINEFNRPVVRGG